MKEIFQFSYGNIIAFVSGIFFSNNIIIFKSNINVCVSVIVLDQGHLMFIVNIVAIAKEK